MISKSINNYARSEDSHNRKDTKKEKGKEQFLMALLLAVRLSLSPLGMDKIVKGGVCLDPLRP